MSAIPHYSRLVCGWPLHVFLVWLSFAKFYKLSSLCVTFMVLLGVPNRHRLYVRTKVLPTDLVVEVASALWPGFLILYSAPE